MDFLSRARIEQTCERAMPFLVGVLTLLVAILLPIAISNYATLSDKSKLAQ